MRKIEDCGYSAWFDSISIENYSITFDTKFSCFSLQLRGHVISLETESFTHSPEPWTSSRFSTNYKLRFLPESSLFVFYRGGIHRHVSYWSTCRPTTARDSWPIIYRLSFQSAFQIHGKLLYYRHLPIYGLIIDPHSDWLPVDLIAQLVECCTGIAEVSVRIPVQAWIFQAFLAAAEVALKCDDQNSFKIFVS
mgnify:CR=1 FL=1